MIRTEVEEMCTKLGQDPLLVQGAGGNVSWKEDNVLWIKASGSWLSEAQDEDIFIPADLKNLQEELKAGNFDFVPKVLSDTELKPSIETILHAIMPQKIVVHLHAVEVLTYLVKDDWKEILSNKLGKQTTYSFVDYQKPGSDLAKGVYDSINGNLGTNLLFLKNHGLVVGAETTEEILSLLKRLLDSLDVHIRHHSFGSPAFRDEDINPFIALNYFPTKSVKLHNLSLNEDLYKFVLHKWALFPDHVVFLGDKPFIGEYQFLIQELQNSTSNPPFIFCKGLGTFEHNSVTKTHIDQLTCYYDVIIRQDKPTGLIELSNEQIKELLNWEAEKYRLSVSKNK